MEARQKEKIEKMLSLAFNNTSRDEATIAFSRAVALAQQSGTTLQTFRQGGSDKEDELRNDYNGLVERYNDLLRRALKVQDERNNLREKFQNSDEINDRLLAEVNRLRVAEIQYDYKTAIAEKMASRTSMRLLVAGFMVGAFFGAAAIGALLH